MLKTSFYIMSVVLCMACNMEQKQPTDTLNKQTFNYKNFELKPGDLLFQDSDCGPFCESIEKVTKGIYGSSFSHVGMVISKNDSSLSIVEAITEGVVETSLDSFFIRSFDHDNNSKVAVGRLNDEYLHLIPKALNFAKSKIGIAYDGVFDINNEDYYCSELIYYAFAYANNNEPVFSLQPMTFKDPATDKTFPIWADYFNDLNMEIPEGKPGLNPGGMSMSKHIKMVYFYGKPDGYNR